MPEVHCYPRSVLVVYVDIFPWFSNFIGSLQITVTDFWWLVWQEGICIVAIVTNVVTAEV